MKKRGMNPAVLLLVAVLLPALASCGKDFSADPGTVTVHIIQADTLEGRFFYYEIETGPEGSFGDETIYGNHQIVNGEAYFTIKDKDNPELNRVFPANCFMFMTGYIDLDVNAQNNGGIDIEMDNPFYGPGGANIDGNQVLTMVYPDDFHSSESGSAGITLLNDIGLMYWRYQAGENDLGTVDVGTPSDYTMRIWNHGMALLTLQGSPYVQISSGDSDVFSILSQPSTSTVYPDEYIEFTMRVETGGSGSFQAEISIHFNDDNNDDPDNASPYMAVFNVSTPVM